MSEVFGQPSVTPAPPVPDAFARSQIDTLWKRTDTLRNDVEQLKYQSSDSKERIAQMAVEQAERDGRLIGSVTNLVKEIRGLSDRILIMEIQKDTKGAVITQWIPTAVVTLLTLVQLYSIFKAT